MRRVSAKERLKKNGFLLGCFVEIPAPEIVESLGLSGFDHVIIDREHAAFSGEAIGNLIRSAQAADIAPVVRVRKNDPGDILEVLDLGAVGLHIPQIATREDASRAVAATRFAPQGVRGFNPFVRAADYGAQPVQDFRRTADEDTLVVLHVEAQDSLDRVEEILAEDGVDVAFLGPYDLSQTMGIPGEVTHARVREAMRSIASATARHGVAAGCFANSLEQAKIWMGEGVTYLAYSVDSEIFRSRCSAIRTEVDRLREELS